MSMFVLNSILSERYPTVMDGLIYTYPFDGEKHCCVTNLKYAKILIINSGSNNLYNFFQSKGSFLTTVTLNLENEDIQASEGQYNLIAIDSGDKEISEDILNKIKEFSNNIKTSVYIFCLNNLNILYNYGGSCVYIDSKVKEDVIKDIITKSSLYNSLYNATLLDSCIELDNGYMELPWDNRIDNFSICFDLEIDNYKNNINLIGIKNNSTLLMGIYFNLSQGKIEIQSDNINSIKYDILKNINLFSSKNKISIIKQGYKFYIYCNDELCVSANIEISTKGNSLIIGQYSLSNINNSSVIKISNLSIYDKELSFKDIDILNKGRLIFL